MSVTAIIYPLCLSFGNQWDFLHGNLLLLMEPPCWWLAINSGSFFEIHRGLKWLQKFQYWRIIFSVPSILIILNFCFWYSKRVMDMTCNSYWDFLIRWKEFLHKITLAACYKGGCVDSKVIVLHPKQNWFLPIKKAWIIPSPDRFRWKSFFVEAIYFTRGLIGTSTAL